MQNRSSLACVWVVLALTLAAGLAGAGENRQAELIGGLPPADPAEEKTTSLTVCVRDAEDQPITGLTREQFRILRDGEEVPLTSFAAYEKPREPDATAVTTAPDETASAAPEGEIPAANGEPVFIIIYVDNPNLRGVERSRVLRPLQAFARKIASDNVQMMVVFFAQGAEIVQPFTTDERAVVNALRSLRMEEDGQDDRLEERAQLQRSMNRAFQRRGQAATGMQQELRNLYQAIELYMDEERRVLYRSLDGVYETLAGMSGIGGRKHLIYVSNGLPLVIGRDLLHELTTLNRSSYQQRMAMPYNLRGRYDSLAAAANSFEVAVHTLDASGADHGPETLGDGVARRSATAHRIHRENRQSSLRTLAEKTGGLAIVDTDDFNEACDHLRTDIFSYYSLGFSLPGSNADKVLLIEAQLELEQEHQLRYQRALVQKSLPSKVQDEVVSALFRGGSGNEMSIDVSPGRWTQMTSTQWMLPVTISVPIGSVALHAEGEDYVGRLLAFLATRDLEGRKTDVVRESHELRIPAAEYAERSRDFHDISMRLLLDAGHHYVAAGVLDENTNRSSYKRVRTASPDAS